MGLNRTAILLAWLLAALASPAPAFGDGPELLPADRKILDELDARIRQLKAAGALPGDPYGPPAPTASAVPSPTDRNGCSRLKPGQSVVVNVASSGSPTGVAAGYGLSRPAEDSFLVELRERFVRAPGFRPEMTDAQINATYHDRVAACFKEFEGFLKEERSGRKLTIRLSENAALPLHEIRITEKVKGAYADSEDYPAEIACSTLLHEQLHLLGLADEYPPVAKLGEELSDCRVTSPQDSIMNNAGTAKASLGPRPQLGVEMCRCEKTGSLCWALAEKNDGRHCPAGTSSFVRDVDPGLTTSLNALNSDEAFVLNEETRITGTMPPARSTVLYPAHFRAITQPGCLDVNATYYGCVINAYRSSANGGCSSLPEACRWRGQKWLK